MYLWFCLIDTYSYILFKWNVHVSVILSNWNIHVLVCELLKVVAANSLVSVRCQHCLIILLTAEALNTHSFPGVQYIAVKILQTHTDRHWICILTKRTLLSKVFMCEYTTIKHHNQPTALEGRHKYKLLLKLINGCCQWIRPNIHKTVKTGCRWIRLNTH